MWASTELPNPAATSKSRQSLIARVIAERSFSRSPWLNLSAANWKRSSPSALSCCKKGRLFPHSVSRSRTASGYCSCEKSWRTFRRAASVNAVMIALRTDCKGLTISPTDEKSRLHAKTPRQRHLLVVIWILAPAHIETIPDPISLFTCASIRSKGGFNHP